MDTSGRMHVQHRSIFEFFHIRRAAASKINAIVQLLNLYIIQHAFMIFSKSRASTDVRC